MKDKWFVIRLDIWQTDILVYVGGTKGFQKRLEHYVSKEAAEDAVYDISDTTEGRCLSMEELGIFALWLKEAPETIGSLGVLNHEVFHMAVMILKRVGIIPSKESEEAYAYLIGFLTKSILAHFTSDDT